MLGKIGILLLAIWLIILALAELLSWAHTKDVLGWGALIVGIILLAEIILGARST